ncbi:MAG: hypothetical protein ACFB50_18310 [Rubrobacteraceae bacterium]
MHGIERTRKMQGEPQPDNGVARIVIRYADGRVLNFIPDGGSDVFSEDDILELKKVLDKASATSEWAEVTERRTM